MIKDFKYIENLEYPEYATTIKDVGDIELIDLSMSESAWLGKKINAIQRKNKELSVYKFSQDPDLLAKIAYNWNLDLESIIITAGCDGALRVISELLIDESTKVLIPSPTFGRYEFHTKVNRGNITYYKPKEFPYDFDIKELVLRLRDQKIDVLFLANPNNPTGIYKNRDEIEYLLKNFSGYVVLDESLLLNLDDSAATLVNKYPKLIICGSFSKVYGLASMRIGYIYAHKYIVKSLKKLVSPYEVSGLGLELAKYVISDQLFKREKILRIYKCLRQLSKVKNKDIEISISSSITCLIRSKKSDSLYETLLKNGIKTVRGCDFRGLEKENCVRVSIKDIKGISALVRCLNNI